MDKEIGESTAKKKTTRKKHHMHACMTKEWGLEAVGKIGSLNSDDVGEILRSVVCIISYKVGYVNSMIVTV